MQNKKRGRINLSNLLIRGGRSTKRAIFLVTFVLFLVLFVSTVSAERLPIVGGDDDAWGTILNNYLTQLAGPNATTLNVSGNFSLGQKIVFALGEVIDNIVDGWIRIIGNLNVTENLEVAGNVSVLGTSVKVNNKEVCLEDGTNCQALVSSGFFVNYTSVTTTGNITNGTLTGYFAANAICNAEYPGTHMCQIHEILNTINENKSIAYFTATFRVSEGAPGYLANANDCNGWKSSLGSALGSIWVANVDDGGSGFLVVCDTIRAIGCCA